MSLEQTDMDEKETIRKQMVTAFVSPKMIVGTISLYIDTQVVNYLVCSNENASSVLIG